MDTTKTPAVHPLLEGTTPEQAQDEACEIYTSTDSPAHVGEIFRIYQDGKILSGPLKYDEGSYEWLNRLRQAYCRGRLAAPTLASEHAKMRAALERMAKPEMRLPERFDELTTVTVSMRVCDIVSAREVLASLTT